MSPALQDLPRYTMRMKVLAVGCVDLVPERLANGDWLKFSDVDAFVSALHPQTWEPISSGQPKGRSED